MGWQENMVMFAFHTTSPFALCSLPRPFLPVVVNTIFTPVNFLPLPRPLSREVLANTLQLFYKDYARGQQGSIIKVWVCALGASRHLMKDKLDFVRYDVLNYFLKANIVKGSVNSLMLTTENIAKLRMAGIGSLEIQQSFVIKNVLNAVQYMIFSLPILNRFGLEVDTNGQ